MSLDEPIINVTQVLQLTNLDISDNDINWSKVKMNGFRWIAIRHSRQSTTGAVNNGHNELPAPSTGTVVGSLPSEAYYPHLFSPGYRNHSCDDLNQWLRDNREDSDDTNGDNERPGMSGTGMESVITVVNPFTRQLYNCQISCDTKCAQISADNDMIAISNDKFLAVYCVHTNQCLNTLPFPSRCRHWNWIRHNVIVVITEREVFHWNIDVPDLKFKPELKFKVDKRLQDYQITGYKCDKTCDQWFAITSLYLDDEGEVNGCVQIHSTRNQLSQCIDAQAFTLCEYKFIANQMPTQVLLAAKRHQTNALKIYIIELGPIQECNNSLISRTEVIPQLDTNDANGLTPDFPVAIECNTDLGLIYVFSKYGALYVCDIETGALITSALISSSVIFSTCFDSETQTVMAIDRTGQLLTIELYLSAFVRHLNAISKPEIAQRIQSVVDNSDDDDDGYDEVTRL
ncbi:unnamed protein product [Oppiella nova]|uniref:Clathrin heavy chain n=1 Tax=Oppiella nova TaxID=334625 RepID=A0A7R9QRW2_9ACAR|nr:unnamed protein product [Oppiella nova]CAG2172745.1 unnamed protein product [Oppiella nova]